MTARHALRRSVAVIACIAGASMAWAQPPAEQPPKPAEAPKPSPVDIGKLASEAPPPPRTAGETRPGYRLDENGRWVPLATPEPGTDEATIAEARRALAEDRPAAAIIILDRFIEAKDRTDNPLLPQAYLLRADATSAAGDEYESLYDYEAVIKQFAGTPEFVTAIERELEIGIRYCNGLNRKWLGFRWMGADDVGQELLIRVQERLPGSRAAERAGIELADYFYRNHDLKSASDAYDLFLQNYPNSPYRLKAMQRRVYSRIGQYKGPRYDGSPLLDAQVLVRRFMATYPSKAEESGIDEALLTRIDESAALQLLENANWYIKSGNGAA
ncbi:MAG: outer membrane protein assembly factor BamD, partial [Phycisphaerae bacterium]|nr:outer membrane protein assembly factor BamD [Phycisphaerae bacterium]